MIVAAVGALKDIMYRGSAWIIEDEFAQVGIFCRYVSMKIPSDRHIYSNRQRLGTRDHVGHPAGEVDGQSSGVMHPNPPSEGGCESAVLQFLDDGQDGRGEREVADGEDGAGHVPVVRSLLAQDLVRVSEEDGGGGGSGADHTEGYDGNAVVDEGFPIRRQEVVALRLDVLLEEDAEEEILVKGEP